MSGMEVKFNHNTPLEFFSSCGEGKLGTGHNESTTGADALVEMPKLYVHNIKLLIA